MPKYKKPRFVEPISDILAENISVNYRCSTCYGVLAVYPAPNRQNFVLCGSCMEATRGYVTVSHTEDRRALSRWELAEVKRNYAEWLPETKKKTEEQLLKELGY